ncbi:hypothetical protein AAG906_021663 [Vitis piasezkii]
MEKISILGFLFVILCLITRDLACKGETLEGNCLKADREALLDFKNGLKDSSNNRLSSWIGGNCCQWEGIGCENNTGVVISIDLHNPYYLEEAYENWSSMNLSGEIRPSLIELKSLRSLDLSGNSFEHIPIPKFFGSLKNLQYLNLSNCGFRGAIPPTLGNLSNLQFLDLSSNESQFFVKDLEWLTNLVSLRHLKLNYVNLSMVGSHWMEVFNKLSFLTDIGGNSFRSKFPIWLLNLSSLVYIDVSSSRLYGRFHGLGELPNLRLGSIWNKNLTRSSKVLYGGVFGLVWNQLVGRLPERLSQLEKLTYLDLSGNKLQGPIPASFGTFKNLNEMRLGWNELNGSLPLSKLKTLWMDGNSGLVLNVSSTWVPPFQITDLGMDSCNLGPSFPTWLRSQKEVSSLYLSNASISGPSFPTWLRSQKEVSFLDLSNASISGNCSSLIVLDLGNNNLSGMIPKSLVQLKWLESLHLNDNKISGELPSSFQNLSRFLHGLGAFINLVILNLRSNVFFGRLPSQLSNLSSLHVLDLAQNNLMGEIPITLFELKAMVPEYNKNIYPLYDNDSFSVVGIDLSDNNLSGELPQEITKLFGLVVLNLSGNHISGQIPESISMLHQLLSLDLSRNKLSGSIPSSMVSLTFLSYLNLSNNNFSGKIPFIGQMTTFNESAFVGNPNLCGAPLVTKCQDEDLDKKCSVIEDKMIVAILINGFT